MTRGNVRRVVECGVIAAVMAFLCVNWTAPGAGAQVKSDNDSLAALSMKPFVPISSTDQAAGAGTAKTAGQVYKNVQIFKDLPATQLPGVMSFISSSLGVLCNYCHLSNGFDKDNLPAKNTARRMIRMVYDLNKGSFNGRDAVTCYTCHRGRVRPITVPVLGQPATQKQNPEGASAPLPTVDQLLDKYTQALGGKDAMMKIKTRFQKGSRVGADGGLTPEEVYQKAPDKVLVITTYDDAVYTTGHNGNISWTKDSEGGSDITDEMISLVKREALFHKNVDLKQMYSKMAVAGKMAIGDREYFVIDATSAIDDNLEKLYFDPQTGLLFRRYFEFKTALGSVPFNIEYDDYRDVDGVKVPFLIRWSRPGLSWGRKITDVKQNIDIDDAKFEKPR